eukprot:1741859-Rhodomonas_salina.1
MSLGDRTLGGREVGHRTREEGAVEVEHVDHVADDALLCARLLSAKRRVAVESEEARGFWERRGAGPCGEEARGPCGRPRAKPPRRLLSA